MSFELLVNSGHNVCNVFFPQCIICSCCYELINIYNNDISTSCKQYTTNVRNFKASCFSNIPLVLWNTKRMFDVCSACKKTDRTEYIIQCRLYLLALTLPCRSTRAPVDTLMCSITPALHKYNKRK